MIEGSNVIFTIGIDKYSSDIWSNLNNAVADCNSLKQLLIERYSFEDFPESLYDKSATKENIYNSFNSIRNYVTERDNLIIFFAGHGIMNPQTRRGYWVPFEGTNDLSTCIENSVIKDFIEDIDAKHIFLIADSCFSGTFLSKTRGYRNQILYSSLFSKKSRWMLASGREEKVSDGPSGEHSPFCRSLLSFLDDNKNKYFSISEMVYYVRILTANTSKQVPVGSPIENVGHEEGEMIFVLDNNYVHTCLKSTIGLPHTSTLSTKIAEYATSQSKIASGKEILFVKSFIEDFEYLILENFRFDDDANKRLRFSGSSVWLSQDFKCELIRRFGTLCGLERYLEENTYKFKDLRIFCWNADESINDVESSLPAIAHANYMQRLKDLNEDIMKCLHCGYKVSTNDGFFIEIDEIDLVDNVGAVHKECIRPCDRIIGQLGYKGEGMLTLRNFDYDLWIELLKKGQAQIRSISSHFSGVLKLAWSTNSIKNRGQYCIKQYFENGVSSYLKSGKNIDRFFEDEIDTFLEKLNVILHENYGCPSEYNPFGMIIETKLNGPLKVLEQIKQPGQTISLVSNYEKCLYSMQFEEEKYNIIENDYTPIIIFRNLRSKDVLVLENNIVPLVSDFEKIDSLLDNWKKTFYNSGEYNIEIIKTDVELDLVLKEMYKRYLYPVINPIFNDNLKLICGINIIELESLLNDHDAI